MFYHRKLRRLVAIELKIGPFEPEFKGQMEYYLRWLDQNEREAGKSSDQIGAVAFVSQAAASRSSWGVRTSRTRAW